jgi:hypothetical protein
MRKLVSATLLYSSEEAGAEWVEYYRLAAVGKLFRGRRIAGSRSRTVWRKHVLLICKQGYQGCEHARRRRKSMR